MKRASTTHRLIALAVASLLISACQGPTATMRVTPKEGVIRGGAIKTAPAQLAPLPQVRTQAFTATTAGGTLTGSVRLEGLNEPYFQNSAAPYRVLAPAGTTLGNAMITLSTLQEEIYTKDGKVIDGLTGLNGAFTLNGLAPKDKPYVVNAAFVGSHRLSAFAFPDGVGNVAALPVDESATMLVETARWQLPEILAGHAGAIADLYTNTAALLGVVPLQTDGGNIPSVFALKQGAGHDLRNAYVAAFGALIGANANATALSNAWKTLLGFRPLALTRAAGNGSRGFNQGDGKPATTVAMGGPMDSAVDQHGNIWVTEQDGNRIRIVYKAGPSSLLASGTMSAGNIYSLMGQTNSYSTLAEYNDALVNWGENPEDDIDYEDPANALMVDADTPLFAPRKLVLRDAGGGYSHLFFLSKFAHRVYVVPGGVPDSNVTMFGSTLKAGRLYTLCGNRVVDDEGLPDQGANVEGGPGRNFALNEPTGLAQDSAGNLYVLDSIAGKVRSVSFATGNVTTLGLDPTYDMTGAQDLQVVENDGGKNYLYVANTNKHAVARFDLAAPGTVGHVMGDPAGQPGFIKAGEVYPEIFDISKAIPENKAWLNTPTSLTFDDAGNMIVAAKGRIHLMEKAALPPGGTGDTYVIAGGLDTRYIVGDSRLCFLPDTTSVRYDAQSKNTLVVDFSESVVRRLWTSLGVR